MARSRPSADKLVQHLRMSARRAAALASILAHPEADALLDEVLGQFDLYHPHGGYFDHPLAAWIAGQSPQDHPAVRRVQETLVSVQARCEGLDTAAMRLPRVRSIWVNHLADWTDLRGFPALSKLSLQNLDADSAARLRRLQAPPGLRTLEVSVDNLEPVSALLEGLSFERLVVRGGRLTQLHGLTDWRELELEFARNLESLEGLGEARRLEHLTVSQGAAIETLAGLDAAIAAGAPLRELRLLGMSALRDASALAGARELEVLELEGAAQLEELEVLGGKPLRRLVLRGCSALARLGELDASRLVEVDLGGASALGDDALAWLAGARELEQLSLRGTRATTLAPLAGLPRLRRLDLRGCEALREIDALDTLPALALVALGGTPIAPGDLGEDLRRRATWADEPLFEVLEARDR